MPTTCVAATIASSLQPLRRSSAMSSSTILYGVSVSFSAYSRSARWPGSSGAERKSVLMRLTSSGSVLSKRRNSPWISVQYLQRLAREATIAIISRSCRVSGPGSHMILWKSSRKGPP